MKKILILILLSLLFLVAFLTWYARRVDFSTQPTKMEPLPTHSVLATNNSGQANNATITGQAKPIVKNGQIQPANSSTKPFSREEENPSRLEALTKMYLTPIYFYGKVLDEKSNPIDGATAELTVADRPWERGSRYERTSDTNGDFSLTAVQGASLAVDVSKDGYYTTKEARLRFNYGGPRATGDLELPTADKPAIFVLIEKGQATTLIHVPLQSTVVPKDGTPVKVDLCTGHTVSSSSSSLQIEVWTEDHTNVGGDHYDWRCVLSIPGGGLTQRTNEYDFTAPVDAYMSSIEISMSGASDKWRPGFQREFFAYFSDGRFARFYFDLATRGSHSIEFESYVNPTLGSRNLEPK